MKSIGRFFTLWAMVGTIALQGCASTSPEQVAQDRATCTKARQQRLAGDPAWASTLDQIQDRYEGWYCLQYQMAWDVGDNPGGGM